VVQEEVVVVEEQATEVIQAEPEVDNYVDEDDEERRRKEAAKYWSLKNSLFANFKQDTGALSRQCFELDWKMSKLDGMLKAVSPAQKASIYGFLRENYDFIREAYRCFAGMSAISNVCCIPSPILTYIAQNCPNLIDNKTLRLADLDLEFIATKAGASKVKTNMNPERQLIRYQFFEILCRLSILKYFKCKIFIEYNNLNLYSRSITNDRRRDNQVFRVQPLPLLPQV